MGFGLAFLGDFAVEALLGAGSPSGADSTLGTPNALYSVLYSLAALVVAIVAWKAPQILSRKRAVALIAFCLVLVAVGAFADTLAPTSSATGSSGSLLALLAVSSVALLILWLFEASSFSSLWSIRFIIITILIEAVIKFAAPDELLANIWVVVGAYAGSLTLFCAAKPLRASLRFKRKLKRFDVRVNSHALLGFLALSFLASIALKALTGSDHYSNSLYGVALLLTALVLWRVLAARSFPSYSALFKIIIALFIAAFSLFSSAGTFSGALILLALTAGSLFWFGVVVFAMQVCSNTKGNPIAVLCGIYALLSCQGLFEPALSGIVPSWSIALDSHLLSSVFVIILTVASLWLLSEKNIDDLFAGSSLPGAAAGAVAEGAPPAASAETARNDIAASHDAIERGNGTGTLSNTIETNSAYSTKAPNDTGHGEVGSIDVGVTGIGTRNLPTSRILAAISAQYGLTAKEQQVIGLYAIGRSAPYIAEELTVSVNTVKSHLANAYQKMGIHSRQELISLVSEE